MGIEKRRYRRLETNLDAKMKDLSNPEGEAFDVKIINLGPEGAFAHSKTLLDSQTEISLSFRLDSYPMEINVIAKVLWRKGSGEDKEDGMGVCFTHIPLFEKNIIIDYILRRYAEHQARERAS
ncbi:MAG: PilZ domain-containing protein [Planctomycetota bacterium]|nr:PilZ domain-containing protein [Planctomycetota bacterium]